MKMPVLPVRRRRRASTVAALALAVVALTATACSSSGGSGGSSDTIAIGNIGTYSGGNSTNFVSAQATINAWAQWTNAHGGIAGKQVKLYVLDDGGSASKALTDAKELVQQDHVVALVGQMSTPSSTWAKYMAQAGVPVVGGNPSDTLFFQDPNFFPDGATANASFAGTVKASGSASAKGGFFYCTESPICSELQPIIKQAYASAGGQVVNISPVTASSPNFTPQCLAARGAGAQSIYTAVPAEVIVSVAKACAQQKYNPYFLTDMLSVTPDLASQLSKVAGFRLLANSNDAPYFATSMPAIATFRSAVAKYQPAALNSKSLTENAVSAWAAGQLFAAAVKASGAKTITGATIKDGLYSLKKGTTIGGLTPPLSYARGKATTIGCIYVAGIGTHGLDLPKGSQAFCG